MAVNNEPKSKFIKIDVLIESCFHNLQQIHQWRNIHCYDRCAIYQAKAESVLEIIETWHCGSVGGFAQGQDIGKANSGGGLFYRWKFLADKYKWKPKKDYEIQWLYQIEEMFKEEDE